MSLNANALTSLAAAKDFLEIPALDTTQDARIERFINAASDMVENYTSRKIKSQTFTEFHDGRNSNAMLLKNWPANKPTAVYIDGNWSFGASTQISTSDYDVHDDGWLVLRSMLFPRGTRNVKVVYIAGYATVPAAVEEATLMLVEYLYSHRNDRRSGVLTKQKNGENISYMQTIPKNITDILAPYIRVDFPMSEAVVENQ